MVSIIDPKISDADRAFIVIRVLLQQFQFTLMRSQVLYYMERLIYDLEAYPGRFEWGLVDQVIEKLVVDALNSVTVSHMEIMYAWMLDFTLR